MPGEDNMENEVMIFGNMVLEQDKVELIQFETGVHGD